MTKTKTHTFLRAFLLTVVYLIVYNSIYFIVLFLVSQVKDFDSLHVNIGNLISSLIVLVLCYQLYKKYNYKEDSKFIKPSAFLSILTIVVLTIIIKDPLTRIDMIFGGEQGIRPFGINSPLIDRCIYAFTFILCVPVAEEVFFRGIIFRSFINRYNLTFSVISSTFLFGLIHINFFSFDISLVLSAFILGVVFSLIYYQFGLIGAMYAHVLHNLVWFLAKTLQEGYWSLIEFLNFGIAYWLIVAMAFIIWLLQLKWLTGNLGKWLQNE